MTLPFLFSARRGTLAAFLIVLSPALALSQQTTPELAPNAPKDHPVETAQRCVWNAMERAMQPYIAQARASWPQARQRYLAGLPARQTFFVTALLIDDADRREQVFIAVDTVAAGKISGRIWNRVNIVHGYRLGERYSFPETDLRDWMIAKPDGTEEGNFVGKFLDSYEPPRSCGTSGTGQTTVFPTPLSNIEVALLAVPGVV